MKTSARELYRAAQDLIRIGQPVFPCYTTGERAKRPMSKHGFKDATTDRDQVKSWIKKYNGDMALGIPTGVIYDVLDVDVKRDQDGRRWLPFLTNVGLLNGCKFVVKTPSGGWHLYFKTAPGLANKARAGLGLDVRSAGGYVLAAPSWVDDGDLSVGPYEVVGPTEDSTDEPLMWDLIQIALAPRNNHTRVEVPLLAYERQSSLAALRGWLSERVEGERNHSLHWAAWRCVDNGIDPFELAEVAHLIGLTEDETTKTINSVLARAGVSVTELGSEADALFG